MQLISNQHGFVLITIPKNACVTLRYWFDYLERGRLHEYEQLLTRPPGNIHADCIESYSSRSAEKGYLKFAVIRNPWLRLASGYFDKIVSANWLPYLHFQQMADFISFLCSIDVSSVACDEHWRGQHTFYQGLKIDKFLKVESLGEDFKVMNTLIGLRPVALPNWKESKARVSQYHGLYGPQEARIIGDLYSADVRTGGYTCPEHMVDPNKRFRRKPALHFKLRSALYFRREKLRKKLHHLVNRTKSRREQKPGASVRPLD